MTLAQDIWFRWWQVPYLEAYAYSCGDDGCDCAEARVDLVTPRIFEPPWINRHRLFAGNLYLDEQANRAQEQLDAVKPKFGMGAEPRLLLCPMEDLQRLGPAMGWEMQQQIVDFIMDDGLHWLSRHSKCDICFNRRIIDVPVPTQECLSLGTTGSGNMPVASPKVEKQQVPCHCTQTWKTWTDYQRFLETPAI